MSLRQQLPASNTIVSCLKEDKPIYILFIMALDTVESAVAALQAGKLVLVVVSCGSAVTDGCGDRMIFPS